MEKPKFKTLQYLDYHECRDYIEHKLGYSLRDTLGKFEPGLSAEEREKREYRDFWHWIVDGIDVWNGCLIVLPTSVQELVSAEYKWVEEILDAFTEEFGANAEYWVEW